MRLICFPYAGGSRTLYRSLSRLLPGIEICAVELPGRGTRIGEAPIDRMDRLIELLMYELHTEMSSRFAMFGHSMGAAIAFELAARLRGKERENLAHLFLSACGAPGTPRHDEEVSGLDDDAFRARLRQLGGTPNEVINNDELMEVIMPMLRADFTLIETYRRTPTLRTVGCDITAFAGSDDAGIPVASVGGWIERTSGRLEMHVISGSHFFLASAMPEIAHTIANSLLADASTTGLD